MSIGRKEKKRLAKLLEFENQALSQGYVRVAGIDEAGRGPLAGPVVAAACILPKGVLLPSIDDSKKLTVEKREKLFETLRTYPGVEYAIGIVGHDVIDSINIYQATIKAMLEAIQGFPIPPDLLMVDGMTLPVKIPCWKIIKGDQLSTSIAAASIIAKVTRDAIMCKYDEEWPAYGFKDHKGYATAAHLKAIEVFGPSPIHRMTFEPLKNLIMVAEGREA